MDQNKKAQHEMASWARQQDMQFVNHNFWEEKHASGPVKITQGKWILRVTHSNGECCQNLVSNTERGTTRRTSPYKPLQNTTVVHTFGLNFHLIPVGSLSRASRAVGCFNQKIFLLLTFLCGWYKHNLDQLSPPFPNHHCPGMVILYNSHAFPNAVG